MYEEKTTPVTTSCHKVPEKINRLWWLNGKRQMKNGCCGWLGNQLGIYGQEEVDCNRNNRLEVDISWILIIAIQTTYLRGDFH